MEWATLQQIAVLYSPMNEAMSTSLLWGEIFKIDEIAGVSQGIKINDTPAWLFCKDMADKVRTNKTSTASYEEVLLLHAPAPVESFTTSSFSQPL